MSQAKQVKITLPTKLRELVDQKASELGLATDVYIKDIEEEDTYSV